MRFSALGDGAVAVSLGDARKPAVLARVRQLAAALEAAREQGKLPGIVAVVPAYASVTAFYDVRTLEGSGPPYDRACAAITAAAHAAGVAGRPIRRRLRRRPQIGRLVEIPVRYGGGEGPDLGEVSAQAGISPERAVEIHRGIEYQVQAIGFLPGFPYLSGLPPILHTPRRATPRVKVPAGSVGIGGAQTGVYPLESPGGWNLIGRTPLRLFRPGEEPPSLLRVGDRVAFREIDAGEFSRLAAAHGGVSALEPPPERAVAKGIEVVKPGLLTTVQDLGRPGYRGVGVSLGGAADPFALRIANLLVGNPEDAAALEITLAGPELEFSVDAVVAIGGAAFAGLPSWRPIAVRAGERLRFGTAEQGCRGYLAVAGGIDVPVVLGGRGTSLRAGFGGLEGRALRAGDRLGIGPAAERPFRGLALSPSLLPSYGPAPTLRVLRGSEAAEFGEALGETAFTVLPQSDRMGVRLGGKALKRGADVDLPSTAVAPGTVQVPPDGQPIVLLADAQTIGGYPQAAHVIGCDLPLAAQLRPGDSVRFEEVSLADAHALAATRERDIGMLRVGLAAAR